MFISKNSKFTIISLFLLILTCGFTDDIENSSMNIQIITNSPLISSMAMMMSNPMFATADGGKLTKIKGQKKCYKI